jgi:predicted dehydrogenase
MDHVLWYVPSPHFTVERLPVTFVLPAPRLIPADSVPALRWGIIGTGIAGSFVHAIHAHTTQRATAVAARDAEKTRAFADEHGIPTVHPTASALINDADIDVVYIATPHPLHHDLALEAIAAGKHLLIEKPIAMSAAEAHSITAAGRAAGVLVMEAMWTRYLPQADVIRQVLADGVLGEIRLVRADFGFAMPFAPEHRLWNAELGGGALLDAGVYPISFASSVIGAPMSVTAVGATASTGVDSSANLLVTTASGAAAQLSTSIETSMPVEATIMGSSGRLDVLSPFFGPSGITVTTGTLGSEESVTWRDDTFEVLHDGLGYQATAFASYVAAGLTESPVHPHHEIVSVMATIDDARAQIAGAHA